MKHVKLMKHRQRPTYLCMLEDVHHSNCSQQAQDVRSETRVEVRTPIGMYTVQTNTTTISWLRERKQ